MKKVWLLLSALCVISCPGDVIEFFSGGDFNTNMQYGSGNNAFSTDSASTWKWDKENGIMKFALKEGKTSGVVLTRIYNTAYTPVCKTFSIKARMRGKGRVRFELSSKHITKSVTLTEKWKNYDLQFRSPADIGMIILMRMSGAGTCVDVDDLSISVINQDTLIVPPVGALLVKPGETVPAQEFKVFPRDIKGEFVAWDSVNKKENITAVSSLLGKAVFPAFTAGKDGYHRIVYTNGAASAFRDVIVAPAEDLDALNAAAKAVDLKGKPMRMLFLADSLTDYDRDHNHPSIIAGLLDKYNPGQITCRNSACGGDQNPRIAMRMQSRNAFRGYMYDGIWNEKYDVIFLFLGQNDTVAFKNTNYTKPQFSIPDVEKNMRFILNTIKKNSDARIIICSGVSTPANTYTGYHFGVPELVEAYNECARKVAAEFGADYCDLYNPLKAFPNEKRLEYFVSDKVHLSAKGHRFVALQILKFLAAPQR